MKRFNPLKKYDKFLDAVTFIEERLSQTSRPLHVPYASSCYFVAPIFKKFNCVLNFEKMEAFCFWMLYKKNKFIFPELLDQFKYLNRHDAFPSLEEIMIDEQEPILKATLYLMISRQHNSIKDYGYSYTCDWDNNFKEGFRDCFYKLGLEKVDLHYQQKFSPDCFVMQSLIDDFEPNPEIIKYLNSFESGLFLVNNPTAVKLLIHDQKLDFDECSILFRRRKVDES